MVQLVCYLKITFIPVVESLTENERNSLGKPEITKGIKTVWDSEAGDKPHISTIRRYFFYHESILSIQIQLKNKN